LLAPAWSTVATFLEFKLHFMERTLRVNTTALVTSDSDSASTSYREAVSRAVATDIKLFFAHGILLIWHAWSSGAHCASLVNFSSLGTV